MSRADHNTHTGDGVARCASCLGPNNSVMFGLTCIDLGENIQVQFSEETGEKYSLQADQHNS